MTTTTTIINRIVHYDDDDNEYDADNFFKNKSSMNDLFDKHRNYISDSEVKRKRGDENSGGGGDVLDVSVPIIKKILVLEDPKEKKTGKHHHKKKAKEFETLDLTKDEEEEKIKKKKEKKIKAAKKSKEEKEDDDDDDDDEAAKDVDNDDDDTNKIAMKDIVQIERKSSKDYRLFQTAGPNHSKIEGIRDFYINFKTKTDASKSMKDDKNLKQFLTLYPEDKLSDDSIDTTFLVNAPQLVFICKENLIKEIECMRILFSKCGRSSIFNQSMSVVELFFKHSTTHVTTETKPPLRALHTKKHEKIHIHSHLDNNALQIKKSSHDITEIIATVPIYVDLQRNEKLSIRTSHVNELLSVLSEISNGVSIYNIRRLADLLFNSFIMNDNVFGDILEKKIKNLFDDPKNTDDHFIFETGDIQPTPRDSADYDDNNKLKKEAIIAIIMRAIYKFNDVELKKIKTSRRKSIKKEEYAEEPPIEMTEEDDMYASLVNVDINNIIKYIAPDLDSEAKLDSNRSTIQDFVLLEKLLLWFHDGFPVSINKSALNKKYHKAFDNLVDNSAASVVVVRLVFNIVATYTDTPLFLSLWVSYLSKYRLECYVANTELNNKIIQLNDNFFALDVLYLIKKQYKQERLGMTDEGLLTISKFGTLPNGLFSPNGLKYFGTSYIRSRRNTNIRHYEAPITLLEWFFKCPLNKNTIVHAPGYIELRQLNENQSRYINILLAYLTPAMSSTIKFKNYMLTMIKHPKISLLFNSYIPKSEEDSNISKIAASQSAISNIFGMPELGSFLRLNDIKSKKITKVIAGSVIDQKELKRGLLEINNILNMSKTMLKSHLDPAKELYTLLMNRLVKRLQMDEKKISQQQQQPNSNAFEAAIIKTIFLPIRDICVQLLKTVQKTMTTKRAPSLTAMPKKKSKLLDILQVILETYQKTKAPSFTLEDEKILRKIIAASYSSASKSGKTEFIDDLEAFKTHFLKNYDAKNDAKKEAKRIAKYKRDKDVYIKKTIEKNAITLEKIIKIIMYTSAQERSQILDLMYGVALSYFYKTLPFTVGDDPDTLFPIPMEFIGQRLKDLAILIEKMNRVSFVLKASPFIQNALHFIPLEHFNHFLNADNLKYKKQGDEDDEEYKIHMEKQEKLKKKTTSDKQEEEEADDDDDKNIITPTSTNKRPRKKLDLSLLEDTPFEGGFPWFEIKREKGGVGLSLHETNTLTAFVRSTKNEDVAYCYLKENINIFVSSIYKKLNLNLFNNDDKRQQQQHQSSKYNINDVYSKLHDNVNDSKKIMILYNIKEKQKAKAYVFDDVERDVVRNNVDILVSFRQQILQTFLPHLISANKLVLVGGSKTKPLELNEKIIMSSITKLTSAMKLFIKETFIKYKKMYKFFRRKDFVAINQMDMKRMTDLTSAYTRMFSQLHSKYYPSSTTTKAKEDEEEPTGIDVVIVDDNTTPTSTTDEDIINKMDELDLLNLPNSQISKFVDDIDAPMTTTTAPPQKETTYDSPITTSDDDIETFFYIIPNATGSIDIATIIGDIITMFESFHFLFNIALVTPHTVGAFLGSDSTNILDKLSEILNSFNTSNIITDIKTMSYITFINVIRKSLFEISSLNKIPIQQFNDLRTISNNFAVILIKKYEIILFSYLKNTMPNLKALISTITSRELFTRDVRDFWLLRDDTMTKFERLFEFRQELISYTTITNIILLSSTSNNKDITLKVIDSIRKLDGAIDKFIFNQKSTFSQQQQQRQEETSTSVIAIDQQQQHQEWLKKIKGYIIKNDDEFKQIVGLFQIIKDSIYIPLNNTFAVDTHILEGVYEFAKALLIIIETYNKKNKISVESLDNLLGPTLVVIDDTSRIFFDVVTSTFSDEFTYSQQHQTSSSLSAIIDRYLQPMTKNIPPLDNLVNNSVSYTTTTTTTTVT